MVPADELTPKGTDIGLNIFIDRALAGGWGKGERLYMQGPWKPGCRARVINCRSRPRELYRNGIDAANAHCVKTYGKTFDRLDRSATPGISAGAAGGKVTFESGLPARTFLTTLYQTVMEGMFADPIYGGNKNKAGWKLIGFPGRDCCPSRRTSRSIATRISR